MSAMTASDGEFRRIPAPTGRSAASPAEQPEQIRRLLRHFHCASNCMSDDQPMISLRREANLRWTIMQCRSSENGRLQQRRWRSIRRDAQACSSPVAMNIAHRCIPERLPKFAAETIASRFPARRRFGSVPEPGACTSGSPRQTFILTHDTNGSPRRCGRRHDSGDRPRHVAERINRAAPRTTITAVSMTQNPGHDRNAWTSSEMNIGGCNAHIPRRPSARHLRTLKWGHGEASPSRG